MTGFYMKCIIELKWVKQLLNQKLSQFRESKLYSACRGSKEWKIISKAWDRTTENNRFFKEIGEK